MKNTAATVRVRFEDDDPTPCYPERLAPAYFAALARLRGEAPPKELPAPKHRVGKAEPYTPAPWKRTTWRSGELYVSVRVVPRASGHGVHGSDMSWTLRGAPSGELKGSSTADARGGPRYAELQFAAPLPDAALGNRYDERLSDLDAHRRAAATRAFRSVLDGTAG